MKAFCYFVNSWRSKLSINLPMWDRFWMLSVRREPLGHDGQDEEPTKWTRWLSRSRARDRSANVRRRAHLQRPSPFQGRTLQDLTQVITAGRFPLPTTLNPELSHALERIILTAMARNREDRYPQSSLMAEALRSLNLHPQHNPPSNPGLPLQDKVKSSDLLHSQ